MKKITLTLLALIIPAAANASGGCVSKEKISSAVLPILQRNYADAVINPSSLKFSLTPPGVDQGANPLVIVIDVAFHNARTGKLQKGTWTTQFRTFDYQTCTPSQPTGLSLLW